MSNLHHHRQQTSSIFSLSILVLAALYLNYTIISAVREVQSQRLTNTAPRRKPVESHSFIGADHPVTLPIEDRRVRLIVEESVHYGFDEPESADEWLWTAPIGDNHVRIGPDHRMFAVAQMHQMHCLRGVREAMEVGWPSMKKGARGHLHHCFNYLRQWMLCDANTTLEPGDFMHTNFTTERTGAIHTCRDWEPTYRFVKDNWHEWDEFRTRNAAASESRS